MTQLPGKIAVYDSQSKTWINITVTIVYHPIFDLNSVNSLTILPVTLYKRQLLTFSTTEMRDASENYSCQQVVAKSSLKHLYPWSCHHLIATGHWCTVEEFELSTDIIRSDQRKIKSYFWDIVHWTGCTYWVASNPAQIHSFSEIIELSLTA